MGLYSPYFYDGVMLIAAAMKAANSTDPAKYLPALAKINYKGVTADIAFDSKGDLTHGLLTIFIVKNGERFLLYTEQGDLIIAKMTPKAYEQISRTHLLDPTYATHGRDVLWSHPAFAGRYVYARSDGGERPAADGRYELVCVALPEAP